MPYETARTLIVGAGPAGLATAAELGKLGLPYLLLERGPTIAHTWENLYDSLTLHTGRHMSTLPGMSYPRGTSLFPTRQEFLGYLKAYARTQNIKAEVGREVSKLERVGAGWRARLADGEAVEARDLVMATGIVAKPRIPQLASRDAFQGKVMHSSEYLRPDGLKGKRVLVVGVGNSGGEIGGELARSGAQVTVAVRSGANVVPLRIGPFPAQYVRYVLGKTPRRVQEVVIAAVQRRMERKLGPPVLPRPAHSPLDAIPLIGFSLVDCIREGLIQVHHGEPVAFTATGIRFSDGTIEDFDVVMFATGFAPAIDALGDLVQRDSKGFAARRDRITSSDQTRLYFVGHNYDHTGGLTNIRHDAPRVAQAIAAGG